MDDLLQLVHNLLRPATHILLLEFKVQGVTHNSLLYSDVDYGVLQVSDMDIQYCGMLTCIILWLYTLLLLLEYYYIKHVME